MEPDSRDFSPTRTSEWEEDEGGHEGEGVYAVVAYAVWEEILKWDKIKTLREWEKGPVIMI